ncbi:MAG: hypothetical protein ACREMY_26195, partial [bacterium]
MLPHPRTKKATERWQGTQLLKGGAGITTQQRSYNRRGRPLPVFVAKLVQRIARNPTASLHPVQKAIDQSGAMKDDVQRPLPT